MTNIKKYIIILQSNIGNNYYNYNYISLIFIYIYLINTFNNNFTLHAGRQIQSFLFFLSKYLISKYLYHPI